MYAKVLIFLPIKAKSSPYFDYRAPPELAQTVRPGVLVAAPFRTRTLPGIVMALADSSDLAPDEIRPIESVLDPEPVLDETRRKLAQWIARETLAPLHKCVQTMLPPGMRPKAYLRLTPLVTQLPPDLPDPAADLLRLLLRRGPLRSSQIARALTEIDWHAARRTLERRALVKVERRLRLPHVRPKTVRKARLIAPPAQWEQKMSGLRRTQLYRAILSFLAEEGGPVELDVICAETGAQSYHLKMLDQRELISFSREEIIRDPLAEMLYTPDAPPLLLPDQQAAWEELAGQLAKQHHDQARRAPAPVLLLGVTGSGKTELYLRATAQVLDRGQQALILVPEISLTPQTVRRFMVRFPGRVGLWHSQLSRGERYDTWQRVRSGEIDVIVGARSALFTPFPNLGLIVIDEEEDVSYKQSRQPYYHARETAAALARLTGALLILGSATPSLEAYARAQAGRYQLIKLERRIVSHRRRVADWQRVLHLRRSRYRPVASAPHACTIALPPVQIVDMRAELQAGNRSIFSGALQSAVTQAVAREEQVLLFLNRRGAATYVFCRDCGWVAECPDCDLPLTAHRRVETLICHHCGHREAMAHTCPKCGSHRVRAFGLGTEGLAEQTAKRWPEARLLRWDSDVARSHTAHAAIMARFSQGEADMLVGTQMIARGLDLPKVTVVGVISADTALNLPDFRAAERTFQLLTQVAGRSGRGLLGGRVILQTYHPDHYAVQYAAAHDYEGFAAYELAFRRRTGYPPAMRLARLLTTHPDRRRVEERANDLAAQIRIKLMEEDLPESDLIGPAPAFFARLRGRYRWQLLLRSLDPAAFLREIEIPAGWRVDIDPMDVL